MKSTYIKNPTVRKILNRGFLPISCRFENEGTRYGWLIERTSNGGAVVRFPGDERARRLTASEARFIEPLS